jgi:putative ABC transport system permease protein
MNIYINYLDQCEAMKSFILITWNSLKLAIEELRTSKLRTFLSLLGITFGIFCIIGVLATVSSMKLAVNGELASFGNHVIFVQKYENSTDNDYPYWRFVKRPEVKNSEMKVLELKVPEIRDVAFVIDATDKVEAEGSIMNGVNYYGVSEKFNLIQTVLIGEGRYFQNDEFQNGASLVVIGDFIAEEFFGSAEKALNKMIRLKDNKPAIVIGVIAKQGKSIIDAWDYDHSIIMPLNFAKQLMVIEYSDPFIMAKGSDQMTIDDLKEEIRGSMRSIRKLQPSQDDNFALNDIGFISNFLEPVFTGLNIGGWAISGLSLIVGMFGVANIMFVTVKERTSQIGLKKSVGAKKINIIAEFLSESIFLCIIGGLIGLLAVFILTKIFSLFLSFKVYIPFDVTVMAIGICTIIGVLSGIIPAVQAANMDPVVAIRSV